MALVAGKYGARAERLRREDHARLLVVITIGGSKGDAFDVASVEPGELGRLPSVLRMVAAGLETARGGGGSHDGPRPGGRGHDT